MSNTKLNQMKLLLLENLILIFQSRVLLFTPPDTDYVSKQSNKHLQLQIQNLIREHENKLGIVQSARVRSDREESALKYQLLKTTCQLIHCLIQSNETDDN
ncbi:Hypothetical_protein [Hexamita inflata]|uniref:Hypothetical_protein n=1 Tax=Hexamita inflata TaxID=28002 RepID=A0ABP1H985_9EUKA